MYSVLDWTYDEPLVMCCMYDKPVAAGTSRPGQGPNSVYSQECQAADIHCMSGMSGP